MKKSLWWFTIEGRDSTIFCQNCGTKVRSGINYKVLFCPVCKISTDNKDVTHVMSCFHCKNPLTIFLNKQSGFPYGRCCETTCCNHDDMADIEWVPVIEKIGVPKYVYWLEEISYRNSLREALIPEPSLPRSYSLLQFRINFSEIIPNYGSFGTSGGRKIPRRPTLEELDSY